MTVQLLKDVAPRLTRLAVFWNPSFPGRRPYVKSAEAGTVIEAIATVRSARLCLLAFPPPRHDRPASDLTPLLGRHAFPPGLAALQTALGTAFFAALPSQGDRVRILSMRHRGAILASGR